MCVIWVWPNKTWEKATGIYFLFFPFTVPLLIIIFCYVSIMCVISRRIRNTHFEENITQRNNRNVFELAKRNTMITLLIVVVCFVVCWSQNQVLYFLEIIGFNVNLYGPYSQYTVIMIFLNCTVNPFVYLIKYKEYQKALKELTMCKRLSDRVSEVNTISSQLDSL